MKLPQRRALRRFAARGSCLSRRTSGRRARFKYPGKRGIETSIGETGGVQNPAMASSALKQILEPPRRAGRAGAAHGQRGARRPQNGPGGAGILMPVSADSERPAVPRQPRPASRRAGCWRRKAVERTNRIATLSSARRPGGRYLGDRSIRGRVDRRADQDQEASGGTRGTGTSEQKIHFGFGWRLDTCSIP